jgi:hypothetical protein
VKRADGTIALVTSVFRALPLAFLAAYLALGAPSAAEAASSDALLRLLQVLRDRGSISETEYDDLRALAETPDGAATPAAPPAGPPTTAPPAATEADVVAHDVAPDAQTAAADAQAQEAAIRKAAEAASSDVVKKTLATKWYEKIGLRGYTQFRYSDAFGVDGAPLEIPADRSVNESESFIIRRGRLVVSGDPTPHLGLYMQADFNGSPGGGDYALQMRDLYADIAFDKAKAWRVRLGQSKVPFGWVNMQSSSNRAPLERPEAINSAVEGERDYGAYLMWASPVARARYRDLVSQGLKGSGDYGVATVGVYNGQGLNRADQNKNLHVVARWAYPFKLASGQFLELGVQGYHGDFVSSVQAITLNGQTFTPQRAADGVTDERVGATAVWYPQPFGVEAEWNVGRGPQLSDDLRSITAQRLHGGYVQVNYRISPQGGTAWFPFARWQYYDGARKFARNAPPMKVNELEFGVEMARWAEVEVAMVYTRTFERTRTSTFPYDLTRSANRLGVQVQWNYP